MIFGAVPVGEAAGGLLAHSVRMADGSIRKGTRLADEHLARLRNAGIGEVVVARLEEDDVHEDVAARTIAEAVAGEGLEVEAPVTGRCNLLATTAGVVVVDRQAIDRLNRIDPAITIATVPEYAAVSPGQMVATVKIIPFAVPRARLDAVEKTVAVSVAAYRPHSVGLTSTMLPTLKASVMDKTRRLLEARLAPAAGRVAREDRVPHETGALAQSLKEQKQEGADILVVFGASAVVDADDVIPAAIRAAGGTVERLGMPVDPGNLLVLGRIGETPVVGAPSCARSPRENGFDWVLQRLLADVDVDSDHIAGLGVGGLLMEIATRPQPRAVHAPKIAALLLAAGTSTRMGEANKLIATLDGKPLVRIAAEAALGSRASSLVAVTGYRRDDVERALDGLDVTLAHNPDFAGGLSTSLRAGMQWVPPDADGLVVLLADMPGITAAAVDRLIAAFRHEAIVIATADGKRGNPVIWPRRFFADLTAVTGDVGGRRLIEENRSSVIEVEIGLPAALDIDNPEELLAAGGKPA